MHPLNVRIIELATARTQPSPTAPDRRVFYFKLSAAPPEEWVDLFERTWTMSHAGLWRPVKIEGACLLIDCQPQEVISVYLPDIRRNVRIACRRYNRIIKAGIRDSERVRQADEAELQLIKAGWCSRLKWLVRSWIVNAWF